MALASTWRRKRLARPIRYTNSKGEDWSNTVADVLTHVARNFEAKAAG